MMRSKRWSAMAVAFVCATGAVWAQETDTKAAQVSAEAWLSLVDNESYSESWHTAANGFKNAVSQERWQALVAAARGPLGKLKERSLSKVTTTKTLRETVTAVKDSDGAWRVGGYFIK